MAEACFDLRREGGCRRRRQRDGGLCRRHRLLEPLVRGIGCGEGVEHRRVGAASQLGRSLRDPDGVTRFAEPRFGRQEPRQIAHRGRPLRAQTERFDQLPSRLGRFNDGHGLFADQSAQRGIRLPTLPYTGFGAAWLDVDNDGWLDILAVNGLVTQDMDALGPDNPFSLQQRNQLLRNLGDGVFEDATERAGAALQLMEVSRGAAFGDIDGDTDVLLGNAAGPARLLVNQIGTGHHWLGLRLVGASGRDMVGARAEVMLSDGPTRFRRARADGSYVSANDPRVLVGLGMSTTAPAVRVTWPNGDMEEWSDLPIDGYVTLTMGEGR